MSRIKKRSNIKKNKYQLLDNEQILPPSNLPKCSICNRRFTESRLVEHQRACKSSSHGYHYGSQLHRWKDLDYHINTKHHQLQSSKIYWKEKHLQLQDIIKGQYHPTDRPYQKLTVKTRNIKK